MEIFMRSSVILVLLFIVGCNKQQAYVQPQVEFDSYYKELKNSVSNTNITIRNEKLLTLSASDMPLNSFLRWISDEAQVSVICETSLDTMPVTLDVVGQGVSDILGAVARRLGVQVTRTGHLFFIGSLRPEDRGVLVRTVKRLNGEELQLAVQNLLSENGRASCYTDGLVVVGDTVQVLQKVNELLDGIDSAPCNSWVVQLFVINYSNSLDSSFGIDTNMEAELAAVLSKTSASAINSSASLNGLFSAVIKAEKENKTVSMIAKPLFVLVDGGQAQFNCGEKIPVAKRAVSDAGTTTTSGFDYIQTGLTFSVMIRESTDNAAKLTVSVGISSVSGYVDDKAPIMNLQEFKTVANVKSGGVYLLGSVKSDSKTDSQTGTLGLLKGNKNTDGIIQIWGKCFRISEG
jgi:type II secretory pathway component GspD/PulD (secretin)